MEQIMISMTHSMSQLHVAWQFNRRCLESAESATKPILMNSEPFRWKFIGHVGRNFHIFVLISLFSLPRFHPHTIPDLHITDFPAQKCTFSGFCAELFFALQSSFANIIMMMIGRNNKKIPDAWRRRLLSENCVYVQGLTANREISLKYWRHELP